MKVFEPRFDRQEDAAFYLYKKLYIPHSRRVALGFKSQIAVFHNHDDAASDAAKSHLDRIEGALEGDDPAGSLDTLFRFPKAYIGSVAKHRCISIQRRQKKQKPMPADAEGRQDHPCDHRENTPTYPSEVKERFTGIYIDTLVHLCAKGRLRQYRNKAAADKLTRWHLDCLAKNRPQKELAELCGVGEPCVTGWIKQLRGHLIAVATPLTRCPSGWRLERSARRPLEPLIHPQPQHDHDPGATPKIDERQPSLN